LLLKELEEEVTYLYHPDHLGSVSVVSNHRGLPYERVEYLPFGEVWIEETDPATGYIPFRFTSKELDEETGLYYHGARYYEPTISRWMSADPAGFALISPMERSDEGGWRPKAGYSVIEAANWYVYVSHNPVKYVDPTGMWEVTIGLAYVLGGRIRLGRNNGRWSIGLDLGLGIGAMASFSPEDVPPSDPSQGGAIEVGGEVSGGVKLLGLNSELGIHAKIKSDESGNSAIRTGLSGSVELPVIGASIGGEANVKASWGEDKPFKIGGELNRKPIEFGLGGMALAAFTFNYDFSQPLSEDDVGK